MQETQVQSLGREDSLEKEMATRSSILTQRILRTEGYSLADYSPLSCKEWDMTEQLILKALPNV